MTVPKADTEAAFRIVCDSHGLLPEECADYIAADLVKREHRENCSAAVEVLTPEEAKGFARASDMDRSPGQEGYWDELGEEQGVE